MTRSVWWFGATNLEQMSKTIFRVAELRNAEIEHSDWLFQVTWLFKTNLCALFLLRVSYATLKFV